jgi:hypothetical protein
MVCCSTCPRIVCSGKCVTVDGHTPEQLRRAISQGAQFYCAACRIGSGPYYVSSKATTSHSLLTYSEFLIGTDHRGDVILRAHFGTKYQKFLSQNGHIDIGSFQLHT